jgi:hypothetical protein
MGRRSRVALEAGPKSNLAGHQEEEGTMADKSQHNKQKTNKPKLTLKQKKLKKKEAKKA